MAAASTISAGKEVSLLLLGKTGHGKSATGNTILGSESFEKSDEMSSVTKIATLNCSLRDDGTVIRVVDAPGVMDTEKQEESTIVEIMEGMSLCPRGFHALVFVIKFGIRYTEEERESLKTLKKYFGSNFLKDFGIVVMTQGDSFDLNHEDDELTFEDWLMSNVREEQSGQFDDLLNECSNRIVLFYNSGKQYIDKRKQGVEKLFELVEQIPNVYTSVHIEIARNAREEIARQLEAPVLYTSIQEKLSLLIEQIKKDLRNKTFSYEFMLKKIEALNEEVEIVGKKHQKSLKFSYLKDHLDTILSRVKDIKDKEGMAKRKEQQLLLKDLEALRKPPAELQIALRTAYAHVASFLISFCNNITFGRFRLYFSNLLSKFDDLYEREKAIYDHKKHLSKDK